ncbi:MAG: hypothetical protein MJZ97_01025 [Bacteroidales bacterium]|nr:hypothetical protein [Bacteroidales bacterium]
MNVMKGEILFFRAGSRLAGRGYDEPRIARIYTNGSCYASPCLPDADMMNREFHESSEWALLSQALTCRTLI